MCLYRSRAAILSGSCLAATGVLFKVVYTRILPGVSATLERPSKGIFLSLKFLEHAHLVHR